MLKSMAVILLLMLTTGCLAVGNLVNIELLRRSLSQAIVVDSEGQPTGEEVVNMPVWYNPEKTLEEAIEDVKKHRRWDGTTSKSNIKRAREVRTPADVLREHGYRRVGARSLLKEGVRFGKSKEDGPIDVAGR